MSDSVRPHRRQPTRLPRPWDSPGKNTGVGCHFLLQYMKVKSESEVAQSCPTRSDPMDCSLPGSSVHGIFQARVPEWGAIAFSLGLYSPWNSPGQNTGVRCLSLLQGNFPNPGIRPRPPALQEDSLPTEPSGKPNNTGLGSLSLLSGNLPNPGIEPRSPTLQVDSLPAEPPGRSMYLHLFLVLVCPPLTTMRLSTFSCAYWPFRPLPL